MVPLSLVNVLQWVLFLHHLNRTFSRGVYLPPPFWKLRAPSLCFPVKCWLTQHWSSLLWSVRFFWDVSSGLWFSGWVCLSDHFYCHYGCLSCHLCDDCLHIFWICHFFFYSGFVCFQMFVCFWSTSVCLVKTLLLSSCNVVSYIVIT